MSANEDDEAGEAEATNHGCPLVAYETLVLRRSLCGLTVHYLERPDQLLAGDHSSLHLVLTPETARGLAQALSHSAGLAKKPGETEH